MAKKSITNFAGILTDEEAKKMKGKLAKIRKLPPRRFNLRNKRAEIRKNLEKLSKSLNTSKTIV